jgi:acetyl-CoA C-acetyltransferase
MPAPVIISAVRTAVATARKGTLALTSPEILATTVVRAILDRSGLAPELIDDIILAESLYGGGAVARYAAIEAGLLHAGGAAINRHCAGSLTSVGLAAAQVMSGMERFVIAGGVMSSSMMPRMQVQGPAGETIDWWMPPTHPDSAEAPNRDMTITVGWNAAKTLGISREEMDAWALRSHQRAISAIDAGHFTDEIVPVEAIMPDGGTKTFMVDEHPRRDSSLEKLASLKVLHPEIEGFSITAGNSSGVNDAASALLIATDEAARAEGADIMARVRGWTALGIDPAKTGLVVPDVVHKLLGRAGVAVGDVALWEINEAFASVPIAACRVLGLNEEAVNISGSGCSIGHPVAASGGRMLNTLIRDLRRRGGGLGVAAMCAGGGQAGAVLIEV